MADKSIGEYLKEGYLYAAGAAVGAANGLLGSGGGMIAVPMLEKSGCDPKSAHATSIAVTLPLSVISGLVYLSKGAVELGGAVKYIPGGLAGAVIGAKLLKKLSNVAVKRLFAAAMIAFGIRMLM